MSKLYDIQTVIYERDDQIDNQKTWIDVPNFIGKSFMDKIQPLAPDVDFVFWNSTEDSIKHVTIFCDDDSVDLEFHALGFFYPFKKFFSAFVKGDALSIKANRKTSVRIIVIEEE